MAELQSGQPAPEFILIGDTVTLSTRVLTKDPEVPIEAPTDQTAEKEQKEYSDCYMTADRRSKTSIYGILRSDDEMIDHSNTIRFLVEPADLLLTQCSKEEVEDVKEVKAEAARQIRQNSKGQPLPCGSPFALRNVEYDLYLTLHPESAGKGQLSLSPTLTPEALFVVKGSAAISLHLEYSQPCLLLTENKSALTASPPTDRFWSITARPTPALWTFHKYESASVSDSYVRFMTAVRVKVQGSNTFLCTKSLQLSDQDLGDPTLGLTTDPDDIACHLMLVPGDYQGGGVGWDRAFYLRQAANSAFLQVDLNKKLSFSQRADENFQLFCKTTKAASAYVSFNLPFTLLTYSKSSKEDPVDLQKREQMCIIAPNSTSQALTLAATFESKYLTNDICGSVGVGKAATVFEIQPVAYEDTLSYRGLYTILTNITIMKELLFATKCSPELLQGDGDILENIAYFMEALGSALKQLQIEVKTASTTEVSRKQKMTMQAHITTDLICIAADLADVMGKKWQVDGLIKGIEEEFYGSEYENSEGSESEEASEDQSKHSGKSQDSAPMSEEEVTDQGPLQEPTNEEVTQQMRKRLEQMSAPTYDTFKRSLDLVLDCVRAFPPGCKLLLSVEKQLFSMVSYARESVGRILTEVFTYSFPTGINRDDYLNAICGHFTTVTQNNVEEQVIFASMLNKLLLGQSLEGRAFAKYTFEHYVSRLSLEEAVFRLMERSGKFYVHLHGCEEESSFEESNPALKGLEKAVEGDCVYYAIVGMDLKYAEYISAFLLLFSTFEHKRMPEILTTTFGVTRGMMGKIVISKDIPMSLRIAATTCFANILSSMVQSEEYSVVDLKAPVQPHEEKKAIHDLAVPGAGNDVKEAICLTLVLAMQTESYFTPLVILSDKEAEEKADFQNNLEKVRFITGLFGLSLALIRLQKVEEPYIHEIMTIVKVGMDLISQKERSEPDNTPPYWYPQTVKSVLNKASKHFDAKTAIEELYACLFQNINATMDTSIETLMHKYPLAVKAAYEQYEKSGVPLDTSKIVSLFEEEIVDPSLDFLKKSELFPSFVQAHTQSPAGPTIPLLSYPPFDPVSHYSLDKCTLKSDGNLCDSLAEVLVNSMPLGLKFEQFSVEHIWKALKPRTVVLGKVGTVLFVEEEEQIRELREKCDLKPILEQMEQLTENGTEGITRIVGILCENPLVCGSNLLSSLENRYVAQSFVNLDP